VNMTEELRFDGKIVGAAVSRRADRWYIAIQVEMPDIQPAHASENQAVGVDLGVKAFATLSDGTVFGGAKAGKAHEAKLRRLNKELSRRQGANKGEKRSKNFIKTQRKIRRLYARTADIRADYTYKVTTMLAREHGLIGIEDLDVRGMMNDHYLAGGVADMSFYEFRRQLTYKAEASGAWVVVADRWFPSSKMCHVCGSINEALTLGDREWDCGSCGTHHLRDHNAAVNLMNYAICIASEKHTPGVTRFQPVESSSVGNSVKQELNIKTA